MTNWEMFNAQVAKAAADGVGKLFRYGGLITVLVLAIIGLYWFMLSEMERHQKDRIEWRAEKKDLQAMIDDGRQALIVCQERSEQQAVQLARLEEKVNNLLRKR